MNPPDNCLTESDASKRDDVDYERQLYNEPLGEFLHRIFTMRIVRYELNLYAPIIVKMCRFVMRFVNTEKVTGKKGAVNRKN